MGSKTVKSCFIISTLALMLCLPYACTAASQIPANTMQAAYAGGYQEIKNLPKSEIVRVGIGDNSFSRYDYDKNTIYGTAEIKILENGNFIASIPANQNLNIKTESGMITLYKDDGSVLEESTGPYTITCENGFLGIRGLKRAGGNAIYRGELEIVPFKQNRFHIVNVIELEEYLKGVVPNEMPVRFGLEALKAQSVAARNYVLSPRTKAYEAFDVADSVASQVYFGVNSEKPLGTQAVEETEGIVAIYDWNLILAQYSSTAGGYTESFAYAFSDPKTKEFPSEDKPYLRAKPDILSQTPLNTEEAAAAYYKSRPDSFDVRSPYFRWTKNWTKDELQKTLERTLAEQSTTGFVHPYFKKGEKLGDIVELKVLRRGDSGKIIEMEVVTKDKTYKIWKELVIRRTFSNQGKALPSANVVFEQQWDADGNLLTITAYGGGYGHGVGMSQYGAGFMGSEMYQSYDKILKHYYSGITLATKPFILSAENKSVTQNFYLNKKKANLIIDNKYQLTELPVIINGKEKIFELEKSVLPSKRVNRINISRFVKFGHNTITFYYPEIEGDNKALRIFVEAEERDDI